MTATINVRSTTGMTAGDTIDVDGESRKIASVGTAATANTTLWQPLPEGPITSPGRLDQHPGRRARPASRSARRSRIGSGAKLEVATVTAVGRAGLQARLSANAAAGATNLKVSSVDQHLRRRQDPPRHRQPRPRDRVGHGHRGRHLGRERHRPHAGRAVAVRRTRATCRSTTGGPGSRSRRRRAFAHSSNEPVQALGTGITLDSPLTRQPRGQRARA